LNQEQGVAAPPAAHTVSPPATPLPSAPPNGSASAPIGSRCTLARLAVPLFAVLVALAFIALATLRWDAWVGHAMIQMPMSVPSSRVAGEVLTVTAKDFQRVKGGDLLVQIDPAVYQAQVAQAEAGVAGAQAALDNLSNQVELLYATIVQAEVQLASAAAQEVEARQEQERQQSLSQTESGTRSNRQLRPTPRRRPTCASRAVIAAQRHQLKVLSGTKKQRAADLEGAESVQVWAGNFRRATRAARNPKTEVM